jgi:hypothetical protein
MRYLRGAPRVPFSIWRSLAQPPGQFSLIISSLPTAIALGNATVSSATALRPLLLTLVKAFRTYSGEY